jgi:hydrogenase nickel incorporation protein HypA/HybF
MHELSVAQNIIEIVRQHMPGENPCAVRKVRLRIGKMAGIVPESLEFGFNVLAAEAPGMSDAVLDMEFVPLVVLCKACGMESTVEDTIFACTSCGSPDTEIITGTELQVTAIEVDDITENTT